MAAVQLGDALDQVQSDAQAAARVGVLGDVLAEQLEDVRGRVGSDARALVGHFHADVGVVLQRAQAHRNAARAELDRVHDQVHQHLADLDLVHGELRQIGGQLALDRYAELLPQRSSGLDRRAHHLGQIERARLHHQLAALQPRQVEDVLDERQQALRLGPQPGHEFAGLVSRQLAVVVVEQLGVRDHARERRLELVAGGAQEHVLHPVQVGEFLVVRLQLARAPPHPLHHLRAIDDRGDVLGEHAQHLEMVFPERLGVVDAVHVEHADDALPDRQRQRQGRGDAAVLLVVPAQLRRRSALAERDRLAPQRHPARDALTDPLARAARELRFEPVGGARHQLAALGLEDHDAGLLRPERAHHPADDDLEDDVAAELELQRGADLEQRGELGQPRAGVCAVVLLARDPLHRAVQLALLEHRVEAEQDDEPGQGHRHDVGVVDAGEHIAGPGEAEHARVERRHHRGERDQQRKSGRPQHPAGALELLPTDLGARAHATPWLRGRGRGSPPHHHRPRGHGL